MNKDENLSNKPNQEEDPLGGIRKKISQTPALQQAADRLLHDLKNPSLFEGEEDMLSIMIDQAIKGNDLEENFPTLHQALINDPTLQAAFNELLELVASKNEFPEGFIPPDNQALSFLKKTQTIPIIQFNSPSNWKIELRQSLDALIKIFSPPELQYRESLSIFETQWYTLIREEFEFLESNFEIILDTSISEEIEDHLDILLQIAAYPSPSISLSGSLAWGDYNHTTELTLNSRNPFPSIPLKNFLDQDTGEIFADLILHITPS